jgi:hypothetical protein
MRNKRQMLFALFLSLLFVLAAASYLWAADRTVQFSVPSCET